MAFKRIVLIAALAAPSAGVGTFRGGNATRPSAEAPGQASIVAGLPPPSATKPLAGAASAEAARLRTKLGKVAASLSAMLDAKAGLSGSQLAEPLAAFAAHLKAVVQETAGAKDPEQALRKLREAQAGMSGLGAKMAARQEELAAEDIAQQQSLLLGVLMTRQHEPMERQMAVLRDSSFSKLPAVAAVLAAKDTTTPLFQQLAAYLDARGVAQPPAARATEAAPALPAKLRAGRDGKPDVGPIVKALQMQLHRMEEGRRRATSLHKNVMEQLAAAEEKALKKNTRTAKQVRLMERAEKRKYGKQLAMAESDIRNLHKAIEAVSRGDIRGLQQTQAALETSMKAMQAQSGGFIYLIQLAHRAAGLDCPYCAAQCIGKCHTAGRPYAVCLSECAEAGK